MVLIPTGYAQANFKLAGAALPYGAEVTLGLDVRGFIGDPSDAAGASAVNFANNFCPRLTSDINIASCLVKFGPTATGPSAEEANGTAGSVGTGPVAANTAVLINKNTAAGGRAGKGRMYIPGIRENKISGAGVMDTDEFAAWISAAVGFFEDMNDDDLTPVLLHGTGSPLTTPTAITSLQVQNKVATQRRRLRR